MSVQKMHDDYAAAHNISHAILLNRAEFLLPYG